MNEPTNPEVLRALAGAPTADVAVLAAESAAIANSGSCRCTEDEACWDHEALEMRAEHLLTAAPEGVDAADELARLREQLAARDELIDRIQNDDVPPDGFDVEPPEAWWSESYGLIGQRVTDGRYVMHTWQNKLLEELPDDAVPLRGPTGRRAPEGVDAADELAGLRRVIAALDAEIDQLAAAQAANQRVRVKATETLRLCREAGVPESSAHLHPNAVLAALDGDTTEEKR